MTGSMTVLVGTLLGLTSLIGNGAFAPAVLTQAPRRSGVFTVSGTLVRDTGTPVPNARIIVAPLVAGDSVGVFSTRISVRVEDGRMVLGAGDGRADQNGRFQFPVRREEFDGPRILFAVLVALNPTDKPEEIMEKGTRKPRGFQIGEATASLDVGRIVVEK